MRSEERVFILELIPGKTAISIQGLLDNRLFTGGNRLRAMQEPSNLWFLKYDFGNLPEPLRQKWTHFPTLVRDVSLYLRKRNVRIKEIQD